MYHYQPDTALEELTEEAVLPNPIHLRDLMIRSRLSPGLSLDLNRRFQSYLEVFGEAQSIARSILEQLAAAPRG